MGRSFSAQGEDGRLAQVAGVSAGGQCHVFLYPSAAKKGQLYKPAKQRPGLSRTFPASRGLLLYPCPQTCLCSVAAAGALAPNTGCVGTLGCGFHGNLLQYDPVNESST